MGVDPESKSARQEAIRLKGQAFVEKVKELIHEGNVRRLVIKNDKGDTVMEIPVTAGIVAAVAAPVVTAIGAIAALASEWSIEVEHREPPSDEVVIDQDVDETGGTGETGSASGTGTSGTGGSSGTGGTSSATETGGTGSPG